MRLLQVIPPNVQPVSLLEAARQLRVADTQGQADALPDKELVEGLIITAREAVENYTGLQLAEATFELVGETLPSSITLPKPPFGEVVSVRCHTEAGETVLDPAACAVLEGTLPAELLINVPADMVSATNGARIRFTAGGGPVPNSLKQAMLLLLTHWYENREEVIVGTASVNVLPRGAESLMHPYRIYS